LESEGQETRNSPVSPQSKILVAFSFLAFFDDLDDIEFLPEMLSFLCIIIFRIFNHFFELYIFEFSQKYLENKFLKNYQ